VAALQQLSIGLVGTTGRGAELGAILASLSNVRVSAVCDIAVDRLPAITGLLGGAVGYTDYEEMLARADLDAVVSPRRCRCMSPKPSPPWSGVCMYSVRCRQAYRLRSVTIWLLPVAAQAGYMRWPRTLFYRPNVIVRELVRRGEFGSVYHSSADYWDEYKAENERTPWRRLWQTGINGITYGSHSLGPLLYWLAGDRIVSVSCVGSGHHQSDPRGDYYENEDCCVMLGRLQSGGLVVLRHDMTSDRPRAPFVNALQGTDGCYESSRTHEGQLAERNRVWLRSRCPDMSTWIDVDSLAEECLSAEHIERERLAEERGYAFCAYFPIIDFVESIVHDRAPAIGIDAALDMTLPGLVSQQSIMEDGKWIEVPDSQDW